MVIYMRKAAMRALPPTPQINGEPGWLYHPTSDTAAKTAATQGIAPIAPPNGQWPDGGTDLRVYFSPDASKAYQLTPEGVSAAVLLRAPVTFSQGKDGTGNVYSRVPVPATVLEIYTDEDWVKIADWVNAPVTPGPQQGEPPTVVGASVKISAINLRDSEDVRDDPTPVKRNTQWQDVWHPMIENIGEGESVVAEINNLKDLTSDHTEPLSALDVNKEDAEPFSVLIAYKNGAYVHTMKTALASNELRPGEQYKVPLRFNSSYGYNVTPGVITFEGMSPAKADSVVGLPDLGLPVPGGFPANTRLRFRDENNQLVVLAPRDTMPLKKIEWGDEPTLIRKK